MVKSGRPAVEIYNGKRCKVFYKDNNIVERKFFFFHEVFSPLYRLYLCVIKEYVLQSRHRKYVCVHSTRSRSEMVLIFFGIMFFFSRQKKTAIKRSTMAVVFFVGSNEIGPPTTNGTDECQSNLYNNASNCVRRAAARAVQSDDISVECRPPPFSCDCRQNVIRIVSIYKYYRCITPRVHCIPTTYIYSYCARNREKYKTD